MLFLKIYRTNGRRRSHENNPPGASPETDPERRRRVHPDRARRRGPAGILRRRIQGRVPRRRTNLPVSRQLDRTALPEPDGVRRHRVGSPGHVVRLGFQLAEPEGGGCGDGHDDRVRHGGDDPFGAGRAQEGTTSEGGVQAREVGK